MSGSVGSAWPSENLLFNAASGGATAEVARNQLLNQQTQQAIGSNEMEMMGRAAATLMDPTLYPTPEARAAAYPVRLAALQAQGFAKNAPSTYPGDTTIAALARMGTPSQTQAEWAQNLAANKAYSNANTPPTTPAAGGGGVAAPGPGGLPGQGGPIEPFATRLQGAEGNPGSVNASGYSGQYQFGTSRLADLGMYKPAAGENLGANQWRGTLDIPGFPDVKTQADFLASPAAQRAALDVHVRNIDTAIAQTPGADQYDANGLRAVAHLGGPEGMRKFVASNGQYDPADANGTHLSDYYRRFSAPGSGGGTAVASTARQPLIRGDSLATREGLGGTGVGSAPPRDVLSTVSGEARAGVYRGQPVVLSTGASNDPGDLASVEQQVQEARGGGASSVTVLGVGPGVEAKAPGTNAALQAIAARNGAQFVPLPTGAGMMSPDGVHPTAQGYATLKTAVAPPAAAPGGGGTPAPYRVAGAMQPPPGAPTAPGQAAPAPGQPAAPGGASVPPAPGQAAPGGGPAPPQLAQLNENGMTPIQQRQIDAMAANPQTSLKERMAAQQGFVNKNIELQQKQFSDWIQTQQLANSQGQLTVAQQNSALEYWKANHPDAKVTLTGGEIITQNPRTGEEIAPRIKVTPNQAPRFTEGQGTWDEQAQQWVQTKPGQRGVPGKWGVGPGGQQFFPAPTEPAQADYTNAVEDVKHDRGEIDSISDAGRSGQQDNIRVQEMRNILQSTDTGHGSETNAMIRAYLQRWAPAALTDWTKDYANLTGPAAVEMFQKLGFMGATSQERGVTSRGGYQATRLFQQFNPGAQLLTATNQGLLAQRLISNQADIDYSQAAQDFYVNQRARFKSPERGYDSLAVFNQQWGAQRNPQVYAGAIGALGGQDPEQWARGLSKDEIQRVKDVVTRADPNAVIHMPGEGRVPLQPNAKPVPPGFTVQ
jgi:hypothetical protein